MLLGLWEAGDMLAFVTPGFGPVRLAVVDHVVVGVVLMFLGASAGLTTSMTVARRLDLIAAGAGAWLVAATFVLRPGPLGVAAWNDLMLGVVVIVVAGWSARVARV